MKKLYAVFALAVAFAAGALPEVHFPIAVVARYRIGGGDRNHNSLQWTMLAFLMAKGS